MTLLATIHPKPSPHLVADLRSRFTLCATPIPAGTYLAPLGSAASDDIRLTCALQARRISHTLARLSAALTE